MMKWKASIALAVYDINSKRKNKYLRAKPICYKNKKLMLDCCMYVIVVHDGLVEEIAYERDK